MEQTYINALLSVSITALGLFLGFIQWRRDVKIKLGQMKETVSIELIRQRIEPYSVFFKQLEAFSSNHIEEVQNDSKKACQLVDIIQENLYGKVGLLSSHETRMLLLYVKTGCQEFEEGSIKYSELRVRLWALHLSLRSDLGISQPMWSSEIERVRTEAVTQHIHSIEDSVKSLHWEELYPLSGAEQNSQVKSRKRTSYRK